MGDRERAWLAPRRPHVVAQGHGAEYVRHGRGSLARLPPFAPPVLHAADIALLAGAGVAAGGVNAVAGGGSLISFPALLAAGLSPVSANVTNAVAVLPGYLGGTIGYRAELEGQRPRAIALGVTTALGGLAGAALLLVTSEDLFEAIVPFLILAACALLAAQPWLSERIRPSADPRAHRSPRLHAAAFAAAVYGGYFGAGLGIMLLAVLALAIDDALQRLNALKGLLSFVIGVASVAFFALFGPVDWAAAAIMAVASFAGGQGGVLVARRLPANVLRAFVVSFGVTAAVWLLID
jgi:uncharacterized membrane protein YfcA